jgi:hypothetical protein
MSAAGKVFELVVMLCRAIVGGLMIYSGVQLLRGEGLLSDSQFDSVMTGVFVVVLGIYCIFSGVVVKCIIWRK